MGFEDLGIWNFHCIWNSSDIILLILAYFGFHIFSKLIPFFFILLGPKDKMVIADMVSALMKFTEQKEHQC